MLLKPVTNGTHQAEIRKLLSEYVVWLFDNINHQWDMAFTAKEIDNYIEEDMQSFARLLPPNGRFYLAQLNGEFVGMGGIKQLNPTTGEIKRMYVQTDCRRHGVGKIILDQLLDDARSLGYDTVYLDSPKFCEAAQTLYQSKGFRYIDGVFPGNENDREYDFMLNFMQLDL